MTRVLVAENVGAPGVDLLREHFDVDEGSEHLEHIGDYDGLVIRSGTKVDADMLARAGSLKAIGRAGVGVDNVDIAEATKRGIVVANAPQSNVVTASEHTMALLLALARNIPRAQASLLAGRWERSKLSGVELMDKTLGIIGFGRIGQLVAQRAMGFQMKVIAFDPYVGAERYRELGVEKASTVDELYAAADFVTIHLPKTPETESFLDAEAFAKMRDGVRVLNVARGPLVDDEALQGALDSGKIAGAALDVFLSEPMTEHPLFGYDNVGVTPHLGASTAEATDRAGYQAAEQVIAALSGRPVLTAVNVPAVAAEDLEVLGPYLDLARRLGRLAAGLVASDSLDRVEVECLGRIAERDTRPLTVAALRGVLSGRTDEELNDVNAPAIASERGIEISETKRTTARDFADLVRVTLVSRSERVRVVGTVLGRRNRAHLLEAWDQRFNLQFADHMTLFRYRDVPGIVGRVGTAFGAHGINIAAAAVGYHSDEESGPREQAVMVVTTDAPVPARVVDELVSGEEFAEGRAVSLV
jgi:D-3-phosphoglycerate dehydrogenase